MLFTSSEETQSSLTVFYPQSLDEITVVLETLLDRKAILVNLSKLNPSESQRFIDWAAGSTHSIDGQTRSVGELTFLFVPSNLAVTSQIKDKYQASFNQDLRQIQEKNKFLTRARLKNSTSFKQLKLFPIAQSA